MADSIRLEGQGIFTLLWDAKEDLTRALLILFAALDDVPMETLLLAPTPDSLLALRKMIDSRVTIAAGDTESQAAVPAPGALWLLFLEQAASEIVGPRLNGWRTPLSQPPGTVLVIRHADFERFQRCAPDLASFIGPRIYNSSNMVSLVSAKTYQELRPTLPETSARIVAALPGKAPTEQELRGWIAACSPDSD